MDNIKSMTSFANTEQHDSYGDLLITIRSVNSRYLDLSINLSEKIKYLEPTLNQIIKSQLKRGKVDCSIDFSPSQKQELMVDKDLLNQLVDLNLKVQKKAPKAKISTMEILKYPGVLINTTPKTDNNIDQYITDNFQTTLNSFTQNRIKEGAQLKQVILDKLGQVEKLLEVIKDNLENLTITEKERLTKKIEQLKINVEPERLAQEITLASQKADIAEEYDRLCSHVQTVKNILEHETEACGKRLDFMMQEFNRESNTIASKVNNVELTQISIELKVLIEQMREQIQNIE